MRRVAAVACVSEATRADLLRLTDVPEKRAYVIPQGHSPEFTRLPEHEVARIRAELGGEAIVLHVGGTQGYKNVDGAVAVVDALRRDGVDASFLHVGGSEAPVSVRRLVELYNACDVFLFPSHYEGFGLPVLEAMACGAPVVVSDAPALRELVGDAGIVAPTDGIADAVRRVLGSSELATTLRQRGIERAAPFTWARTAERYAALYAAVAEAE
jgi:glycosyltransferase involved in cell wall biosynthesis